MSKTKQTLYNFVSLRSPQLVKPEEKDFRFIEIPDCKGPQLECPNVDLVKLINEDARAKPNLEKDKTRNECSAGCNPTNTELNNRTFTDLAEYIAQHKAEIDYTHLDRLRSTNFQSIKVPTVKLLFYKLVQNLNTNEDFALKERICDWLVLWNILENLNELHLIVERALAVQIEDDRIHCKNSFSRRNSIREFKNLTGKPYVDQLLNATVILPAKEILNLNDDARGSFKIKTDGPIGTKSKIGSLNHVRTSSANEQLERKHRFNLAAFLLDRTSPTDILELQRLRGIVRESNSFSSKRFFSAGMEVYLDASGPADDVKGSIVEISGTYYLYVTSGDERIPYQVNVWTKKPGSNQFFEGKTGSEYTKIQPSGNQWFSELLTKPDLNPDTENFFLELKYTGAANESIRFASLQVVSVSGRSPIVFEGNGKSFISSGFIFSAQLFNSEKLPDAVISQAANKESRPYQCKLVLKDGIKALGDASSGTHGEPEAEIAFYDEHGLQTPVLTRSEIGYNADKTELTLTLKGFPENLNRDGNFSVIIFLRFADGKTYSSLTFKIWWDDKDSHSADGFFIKDGAYDAYGKTYAPKGFGVTQLGVADYQRVTSHAVRYEAGEVAHIENLMGREYKEKVVTKEHITEVTTFDSLETETEKLKDTTTAERFQMQTEIAKIQHEDNKTNVDAHASYNGGTTTASINYGNATNTSRDESNKQAITTAKELTNRAMERIVSKVKTERTVKVTDRLTDVSKQGFDNRGSSDHVSGVYRYINAIYKNEIENYGKRLAYEFAIPQPSKLHNLGTAANTRSENIEILEKPEDPRKLPLANPKENFRWDQLDETNYLEIARKYDAQVTNYPEKTKRGVMTVPSGSMSFEVPIAEGYTTDGCTSSISFARNDLPGLTARGYEIYLGATVNNQDLFLRDAQGKVILDASGKKTLLGPPYGTHTQRIDFPARITTKFAFLCSKSRYIDISGIAVDFDQTLDTSSDLFRKWQREVYSQIIEAYEKRLSEFYEKLNAIKQNASEKFENNPLNFRQIEQTILRMNCISYLIAPYGEFPNRNFGKDLYSQHGPDSFSSTRIDNTLDLDEYAAFVKFIEQAFEWNIMSYSFYPFYWGNKDDWDTLYQNDISDPLFKSFMQAGMARVVVTVRPGFEYAVLLYMITGKIWAGGRVPVYGDTNYVSIVNELKEQEYTVKDSWETVLPTNLIALQKGGAVINTHGLPNLEKPVIDKDDDEIEDKGSSLNPLIGNNEKVLETKTRSWFSRLIGA